MKKLDKTDEVDKSRRFGLKDGCWERKGIFHRQPVCLSVTSEWTKWKVRLKRAGVVAMFVARFLSGTVYFLCAIFDSVS